MSSPSLRSAVRRPYTNRSQHVWTVAAVVLLVGIAGCAGVLDDDSAAGDGIDYVPEHANVLVEVNLQASGASEVHEFVDGMNDLFLEEFGEPFWDEDVDDILDEFESETGLDYTLAEYALIFGETVDDPTADEEVGIIIQSGWDHADVADAVADEEPYDLVLTEYAGEEVLYAPDDPSDVRDPIYVGILPGNLVVIGDEGMVKASLDVAYDGAASVSGAIVDVHEQLSTAGIAITLDIADLIEEDEIPDEPPDGEIVPPGFEPDLFQSIEVVGTALFPQDGAFHYEMVFDMSTEGDAQDLTDVIDGALSMYAGLVDDDQIADEIRSVEIDHDGTSVTVVYDISVENLLDLVEGVMWMMMGLDVQSTTSPVDIGPTTTTAPTGIRWA